MVIEFVLFGDDHGRSQRNDADRGNETKTPLMNFKARALGAPSHAACVDENDRSADGIARGIHHLDVKVAPPRLGDADGAIASATFNAHKGAAGTARFDHPCGIAASRDGDIYVGGDNNMLVVHGRARRSLL